MVRTYLAILLLIGFGPCESPASGSPVRPSPALAPTAAVDTAEGPSRGVVWTPPRNPRTGLATLNRMARFGVTAVRVTRPVIDAALLARADSLGLSLYMDLPDEEGRLSGSALRDTIAAIQAASARHRSIRAVGLAPRVPGTDSVCEALEVLADQVGEAEDAPSLRGYYVTALRPGADPCADTGDVSLLVDVRHARDPVERWSDWLQATGGSVGIGALGAWMRPDAGRGLRTPHSPEWQARRLETQLGHLFDADPPPAVFVCRWHDASSSGEPGLPARAYGLTGPDGSVRPAGRVVRGFYTGRQQAFAFPRGPDSAEGGSGLVVLGWIVLAGIAFVFAQEPLARRTAARYFSAHGFYRDAVREGRETLPRIQPILLLCVAVAVGTTVAAVVRGVDGLPETGAVLHVLPEQAAAALDLALAHPSWVGAGIGALGLVVLIGWSLLLVLAAREWERLRIDQALMLVSWPCWPAIPLMVAGLVAVAQPAGEATGILAIVCAAAVAVSGTIVVRVLRDFVSVTGVPDGIAGVLALLSPPSLTVAAVLLVGWRAGISLSTLWHLIPRL